MSFRVGDWVRITPSSDPSWHQWGDVHDHFRDEVGQITLVKDDPDEPGNKIYRVSVFFDDKTLYDQPEGYYWLEFKGKHVIIAQKVDAKFLRDMRKAGKELQEWENFKRKSTDDMLRDVFAEPPRERRNKKPSPEPIPLPPPDDEDLSIWEQDTDPGIPLPGSVSATQDVDYTYIDDVQHDDDDLQKYFDDMFPDDYD